MMIFTALAFIPFLLMFILGFKGNLQTVVTVLPLTALLLHLLFEGLSWQLTPLYLLAIALTASLVLGSSIPKWLSFTGVGLGVALVSLSLFLAWLFPNIKLPTPRGPFAVGTTSQVADNVDMQLWYPATSGNAEPYLYLDGMERTVFGLPKFIYSHLKGIPTTAFIDAPLSEKQASYPLVIYVHGANSFAEDNTFRLIELASQGFVIAAVEHPQPFSKYGITAEDARDPERFGEFLANLVVPERVQDVRAAIVQLETLNKSDAWFKGRLQLADIGMLGFSLGGSIVTEYCLEDSRCRAVVNLDGSGFAEARATGVNAAYLQLSQSVALPDKPVSKPETVAEKTAAHYLAEVSDVLLKTETFQDVYWLRLEGSGHASFTDLAHWTPVRLGPLKSVMGEGDAHSLGRVINDLTVAFFKERLANEVGFDEAVAANAEQLKAMRW